LIFSFLAGIFTVLTLCILPVLPALLSGGTLNGRLRPLGIVLGLMISFNFFTLALTASVHATGLTANVLRVTAIAIIFLFGVVIIFP
jgi:cytochrome c biogenesis protein CcdA